MCIRDRHYYHHIDENKLNEAAQHFMGAHDFTSFCTLDNRDMGDFTRTVTESSVTREGDMVRFTVAADGFLYNMVRAMTGTIVYAAEGKLSPQDIPAILESGNRTLAGPTVPPGGLYMTKLWYDEDVL